MKTIYAIFSLSLGLSLILTPLVARFAKQYHLVDTPSARKVHTHPTARPGGVAIFLAFFLSVVPCFAFSTIIFENLPLDPRIIYVALGACVAFGVGLWDDIRNLGPNMKLAAHGLAGLIAYVGGIRIETLGIPGTSVLYLGWLSLPVTVLWIVLLINAINLIDGLDGLASGVSFLVCIVLFTLCMIDGKDPVVTIGLASLAGASLGFLRYNFNPASIFLGDSGSYFLGYMLATLSILGSMKSHTVVSILIPMIALGLPLMDTIWSAIRRFILGQRLFYPDKDHFHHRLLKLGYSKQWAVMLLYGITICLGAMAFAVAYFRDIRTSLILLMLLLLGVFFMFAIRRLRYLGYINGKEVLGWLKDISDEIGIRRERRTFLGKQVAIYEADNLSELWDQTIKAAEEIDLSGISIDLNPKYFNGGRPSNLSWKTGVPSMSPDLHGEDCLLVELPLICNGECCGRLDLKKVLKAGNGDREILNRAEHLRRCLVKGLEHFIEKDVTHPEVLKESVVASDQLT